MIRQGLTASAIDDLFRRIKGFQVRVVAANARDAGGGGFIKGSCTEDVLRNQPSFSPAFHSSLAFQSHGNRAVVRQACVYGFRQGEKGGPSANGRACFRCGLAVSSGGTRPVAGLKTQEEKT
jgi:hypothetical protein